MYQSNIPQPTDQLSISQGDLLGNFQAIATLLMPSSGTVTFPNQVAIPVPPANQPSFYSFIPSPASPYSTLSELYLVKNNIGGGAPGTAVAIPITASVLSAVAPSANLDGWAYLPSGLLIKWGSGVIVSGHIVIPSGAAATGPAFTQVFSVQLTPRATLATVSWNGFTIGTQQLLLAAAPSAGVSIAYFIIGVG